jgi:hypothetical protein
MIIYYIGIYMSRLSNISKKSILMYAGVLTVASIAFMLVTGIMGSDLTFGGATVFIRSIATTKMIEEDKATGVVSNGIWSVDVASGAIAIENTAIPIDDKVIERFPRTDEIRKGLESQAERIYKCGGMYPRDCSFSYEFKVSKFEADAIKNILRELAIQHNKSKDDRSEAVKAYDPEKDKVIDGVIDSTLITVKYGDVYYHIGVSQSYIMP